MENKQFLLQTFVLHEVLDNKNAKPGEIFPKLDRFLGNDMSYLPQAVASGLSSSTKWNAGHAKQRTAKFYSPASYFAIVEFWDQVSAEFSSGLRH